MKNKPFRILVYGIGNPGRQDDGLGIALSQEIGLWCEKNRYSFIDVAQNYQLNIEDAEKISNYDLVIFVDASLETDDPYKFEVVNPARNIEFTMHSVSPSLIVALSKALFGSDIKTYQLHIKATCWEFMEPLSEQAMENLKCGVDFIKMELEKYLMVEKQII